MQFKLIRLFAAVAASAALIFLSAAGSASEI